LSLNVAIPTSTSWGEEQSQDLASVTWLYGVNRCYVD
jgi:hypothetical protein